MREGQHARRRAPSPCGSRAVVRTRQFNGRPPGSRLSRGRGGHLDVGQHRRRVGVGHVAGLGRRRRRQQGQRQPFFLGEVGLDQVLGDRGAQVAVLVVLAEDHAGNLRVVLGREEHEPPVVAQVAAAVARRLPPLNGDDLRRAGLAGDVAARQPGAARRAGAVDRQPQPVMQCGQRARPERHAVGHRGRGHGLPAVAFVHGLDDVRRHARAAVGHRGDHHGQRCRRHRHLSLADRHRDGLAGVPLLPGPAPLPFGRGHDAVLLVRQVDAGLADHPELLGPLVDLVHAEHVAQRVEVDVAGLLERVAHVHRAVPAREVALEVAAEERRAAVAGHAEVRIDEPFLECRRGDHDLEGGARRVAALHHPVLQRTKLVGVQRRPLRALDAHREVVGVVGRQAGVGQHFPVARVEHQRRAVEAGMAEAVLGRALHVGVDRQLEPAPLDGRHFLERADLPAEAVDHDHPGAVAAHQQVVVGLFQPLLTDDRPLRCPAGHLGIVGFPDVAEQVRRQRVGGVSPRGHFLHDHVGQLGLEAPRANGRHLRQRGVLDDDDRPVGRLGAMAFDRSAPPASDPGRPHATAGESCASGRASARGRSRW